MDLDGIMAELYAQGRRATKQTAKEIIRRFEEKKYIPSTEPWLLSDNRISTHEHEPETWSFENTLHLHSQLGSIAYG
jgi:hypothetical protein